MTDRSAVTAGLNRSTKPIWKTSFFASANSISSSASASVVAIGFSSRTSIPAFRKIAATS